MSSPLNNASIFRIPRSVLRDTIEVLANAGGDGHEAFVVWGGTLEAAGTTVTYRTAMAPRQTGHRTTDGLLVTVDGDALFEVNRELYSRGQVLAGQVHSHPGTAYHSSTDDHFPLVTLAGALSVVIPDFAAHAPEDINDWAWYRLIGTTTWAELTRADRIEIIED